MSKAETRKINPAADVPCMVSGCRGRAGLGVNFHWPKEMLCDDHLPADFHALRDRDNAERAAERARAA